MRYNQSTLKPGTVHAYARDLLRQTLELEQYRPAIPLGVVCSVLLLAACWQTSLTGACRLVQDKPSHHHVRTALYACLPPRPRDLLSRLLAALRRTLPDHLGRVPRPAALDLHQRPYYGKKSTKGVTRRQKKASTRKSFTYATLAVLDRGERFTVGLLPTRPHMRLTTYLEQLLGQAAVLGLQISYLMLDKEFYSAEVIQLLQKRGLPFLMPAVQKGRAGTGNSAFFAPAVAVGWYDYTWAAPRRRMDFQAKKRRQKGQVTVRVRLCVARRPAKDKAAVYATGGLGKDWSPAQVAWTYRRRFGIETQYRQLGQCLARTSARCERLRLLLVGLALLLGNLWALLHSEAFSDGALGERQRHLGRLRLLELITALAHEIAARFGGWLNEWAIQRPIPHTLRPFVE